MEAKSCGLCGRALASEFQAGICPMCRQEFEAMKEVLAHSKEQSTATTLAPPLAQPAPTAAALQQTSPIPSAAATAGWQGDVRMHTTVPAASKSRRSTCLTVVIVLAIAISMLGMAAATRAMQQIQADYDRFSEQAHNELAHLRYLQRSGRSDDHGDAWQY